MFSKGTGIIACLSIVATILSGCASQTAQAPFAGKWWRKDPQVWMVLRDANRFVGSYMEIENRPTDPVIRIWGACSTSPPNCDERHLVTTIGTVTEGEELVYYYDLYDKDRWLLRAEYRFVILSNGHLLQTITEVDSFKNTFQGSYEYVR